MGDRGTEPVNYEAVQRCIAANNEAEKNDPDNTGIPDEIFDEFLDCLEGAGITEEGYFDGHQNNEPLIPVEPNLPRKNAYG